MLDLEFVKLPGIAVACGAAALLFFGWLLWCRPTEAFVICLTSLTLRPQLLWDGPRVSYHWDIQHTLMLLALLTNAAHFGFRRTMNWPILALLLTLGTSLAFGNPHPSLNPAHMLASFAFLALPFCFAQVRLEPGSRRRYGSMIAAMPLLSIALGVVLQALHVSTLFMQNDWSDDYRLQGAVGDPEAMGVLACVGFAVALHEASRPRRPLAIYVAAANGMTVLLSGTRMAIASAVLFGFAYGAASADIRGKLSKRRWLVVSSAAVLCLTLWWYGPFLATRLLDEGGIQLSGRDLAWNLYLEEFEKSPAFGRGIGAESLVLDDTLGWERKTPHNEYIRFLTTGGIFGAFVILVALVLWFRGLLVSVSLNDRPFVIAAVLALPAFAFTQDILTYWTSLGLFVYLSVILTQPVVQTGRLP